MPFRKLALATAATTLAIAPIGAQAAAPLRAAEPVTEASDLAGGSDIVKALIIVLIAGIGMAALLIADDDDSPVSP